MTPSRTLELLPSLWERLDFLAELEHRDVRTNPSKTSQAIRCPFPERHAHGDRTPSCSITQTDQKWLVNCHGCGFQGDGIDMLAAIDQQTVPDWMRARVSRDPAVPLPHRPRPTPPPRPAPEPSYDPDELAAYLDDCHAALLSGPESGRARHYLRERGLRREEILRYRFGYPLARPPVGVKADIRGRLLLPVPGAGFEARSLDGAEPRYKTVGLKHPPWGIADLDPARSPLLLVEGILDAIACRRVVDGQPLNHNTIALRGKGTKLEADDARHLARLGFREGYVCLDDDAKPEELHKVGVSFHDAGIRPWFVRGLPAGHDFGGFLPAPDDELVAAFVEAVRLA